jgi:putative addiction module component (TIGR02574 family)
MSKLSAADVLELPVAERLKLIEDIWNSIADAPEALELTDEDKKLIDARLEARRRNPSAGSPWEEVYARITSSITLLVHHRLHRCQIYHHLPVVAETLEV